MPLFFIPAKIGCLKEEGLGSQLIMIIKSYYLGQLKGHGEVVEGIHDSLKVSQSSDANDFKY
jgi:hypothetical protein